MHPILKFPLNSFPRPSIDSHLFPLPADLVDWQLLASKHERFVVEVPRVLRRWRHNNHLQIRAIAGRRGGEVKLAVGGRKIRQHNLLLLQLLPRRCSNSSCLQAGRSAQGTQRLPVWRAWSINRVGTAQVVVPSSAGATSPLGTPLGQLRSSLLTGSSLPGSLLLQGVSEPGSTATLGTAAAPGRAN